MLVPLYVNYNVEYSLYLTISLIDRKYREYLEHILEYLTSFLYRTEPLQDIDKIFLKVSLILPFSILMSICVPHVYVIM
jgi:hypothetical protein